MELDAGLFLQVPDDAEEVAGLRIAARTEHANEALRLRAGRLAQLLEPDGRLDVVGSTSILAGKALRGASFNSLDELKAHIDAFTTRPPAHSSGQHPRFTRNASNPVSRVNDSGYY
jgi:hypothetical protein